VGILGDEDSTPSAGRFQPCSGGSGRRFGLRQCDRQVVDSKHRESEAAGGKKAPEKSISDEKFIKNGRQDGIKNREE
jgi:hypothetical protein